MDLIGFVLVVALAAGVRVWYVSECVGPTGQPPFLAQAPAPDHDPAHRTPFLGKERPTELDNLAHNIHEENWFAARAPLSVKEEDTAHVAPGYPWALALAYQAAEGQDAVTLVRWVQCGLGALTVGLYFCLARFAFGSLLVAVLTGLLCAVHPFWVANTAQIQDGVLVTFALASCLVFGTRAGKDGGPFSSFLFGLSLAGVCLVRAALVPFALVGLLWFLWRCRDLPRGWFYALLAVLGFANVAPWTVRNYQTFGEFVPVADSAWLHVWMGNNPAATGAELDRAEVALALGPERMQQLLKETNQPQRYRTLAEDAVRFVTKHPDQALRNRIQAGLYFLLGAAWFEELAPGASPGPETAVPGWLRDSYPVIVQGTLLGMLVLALLGWRSTHVWRSRAGLATLALIFVPLPYVLGHAETLWGPRLPLDGLLLCLAAFALVYLIPGVRGVVADGPADRPREV
jgi:hypothetical protein